ncbi:MAG TPA: glycosyltransferase family 2 protein [Acidimicrobiales bacterium]|nr:glycosyltransferase family 2 protein [Acidimicrobiales bacterium]
MPAVSIVLPTLNERAFIRDCLDSLAAQDYPEIAEILVVDGGSRDGTRDLVAEYGAGVRLIDNPRVTAAAAMNIGIDAAKGDVICRADAHTLYAPDYVSRCVAVLDETGAANVGGRMRAVGTSNFGRAVAAVTSSPLGVGPGRFHYSQRREEVDTVYLGCWKRATLLDLGGYDESRLQWAAEDQELNLRLREAGGTVMLDPDIHSWYFPRDTPRALARQYANYGMAKASTLGKHRTLPSWRPLAPAGLVAATVLGLVFGRRWWKVAVPLAHTAVCAYGAVKTSDDPGVAPHRAFAAFELCHWAYGFGFWRGIGRLLSGRGFDTRPRGGRR